MSGGMMKLVLARYSTFEQYKAKTDVSVLKLQLKNKRLSHYFNVRIYAIIPTMSGW